MKKKFDLWVYAHPILKKLIMTLKIAILIVLLSVSNVLAIPTYSQVAKVSLDMGNRSLEQVMDEIERQSEFYFIFNQKQVDVDRVVDIQAENKLITEILPELFKGTNVNYIVFDRKILLTTDPLSIDNTIMILESDTELQQTRISGTVTDASTGEAMAGVNISVKGTTIGTITDGNGKYSMFSIVDQNTILVVSFIGYVTQEVPLAGENVINVVLKGELIGLDEVVVVGFGTQKKANLTGSVATVKSETLESRPVSNAIQALQGLVPGLNIKQSGELGGALDNLPTINIRGTATIGQGSSGKPLILIDGMEGDLNRINPQDIDNISILKDASASSIYGSRAPFGVILITTKKGKSGKPQINISSNFRWSSPVLLPEMSDSYSYALYINDASTNAGQLPYFGADRMQRIRDFIDGKITTTIIPDPLVPTRWAEPYYEGNSNTDVFKFVYRNQAPSQEHTVNLSGGNENVTYYVSGSYLGQEGLLRYGDDNFKRYNLVTKINFKLSDWASVAYTGRFIREDFERPTDLTNTQNYNLARGGWPMLILYDNNGYLFNAPNYAVDLIDGGRAKKQSDDVIQQFELTLEPIKDWKIFGRINYRIGDQFYHWDHQLQYNHDVAGNPYIFRASSYVHEESSRSNYFGPNIYSEYSKTLGDHSFKVMAGFQSELSKFRDITIQRAGIIAPSAPVLNITSGNDYTGKVVPPSVSGGYDHWATEGFFGRLNYDYRGRYLIEVNLRYDGTSRFGSDKRWNYFPSGSIGWNVAREDFWKSLENYVNNFKIRSSYGELGNQNTSNLYPTYVTMPIGISNGSWLVGGAKSNTASAPGLISSSLSWERVKTWNIGTDLGFFKNRLTSTFDYFVRYTNDMIGPAPELPIILGTSVPRTNNTNLKTDGFELSIAWQDRFENGLGYNINFVLSDSKTRITRYPNPTGNLNTYLAGRLMGEIWGFNTLGIAKTQAEMDAHLASLPNGGQSAIPNGSNWKAGDIMYQDLNGDGKINTGASTISDHGDLTVIGNTTPRYLFGFDLSADWKGFDIRGFIQGLMKKDMFQNSYYFWGAMGIWTSTAFVPHLDYFRDDPNHPLGLNMDSYYPRPIFDSRKNQQTQSRYLQNTAYARLKNLQVGYTVPLSITKKLTIQKLRVYVSGENILTKSNIVKMFDPETIDGGWGGNIYPLCKVYSVGVNINF